MFMLAAEVTTGVQTINISAASTQSVKSKAKKAYKNYVQKYLSSTVSYPDSRYKFYDINRDGIPEMFFNYRSGVRGGYKIYTYKKGKIIKMLDVGGAGAVYRNTRKKQICISFSSGAASSWFTCYKMKNKKLIKIRKYYDISDFRGTLLGI